MIGAGGSGITACQVLGARGIPFDCFEKGSEIGGNWRYENDNGMSSAYRSLHINTSRRVMAYKALPMPDHYPDYPDHFQMAAYFDEFVDHFGLRDKIRFRTEVASVEPADEEWEVTVRAPTAGARASATAPCSSPTATTGTRAGPNLPSPVPRSSPASRSTSTTTARPTCCGASGSSCSASATPRPTLRSSPRGSPTRPSWRCAAAPTCCPST